MFIEYTPGDGETQRWEFDPRRIRQSHAEIIENRFGGKWDAFLNDIRTGSAKARRVVLWYVMWLQHPTLRYEDTPDFYMGELEVAFSSIELRELRERLHKANLDEATREQMLTAMDIEISTAMAKEEAHGLAPGKAPLPTSESDTASP